ncbi:MULTISPECIES: type I-F CRISPR-associated endonuclease Cas1f [Cysteiniphilum]|uniref:type I-F CRISPR-associated endonuclease Cas1f n=1 Tax=Cysteiniphilum TaxID=2056696 RepID=UPI00177AEE31|nr:MULTISPECIES: type I-F CRISPR-associated endonuclease Cas1f [Cysteiniphilum]
MEALTDLKAILTSKRANLYYLEHCRVMQKDGRVLYLTEAAKENQYWNIPIANTTVILLGTGTSITQAAIRMLASAGVLVGFCGGGGTPLLMANEVEWLTPQSEYRPTEYVQSWLGFWFDDKKRLQAAITFQKMRCEFIRRIWQDDVEISGFGFSSKVLLAEVGKVEEQIQAAKDIQSLFSIKAHFTKLLYKQAAGLADIESFKRDRNIAGDLANSFLNHGNYLAYGLAATTLWVLGIPHGFAVMHGKTRRGALVFDVADLVKDAIVLPMAFISAKEGMTEQEFRGICINKFTDHKALDYMFECVKEVALYDHSKIL